MSAEMTSNQPYLIRAMYDWICDNGLTVHLLVNTNYAGVEVPIEFAEDGQIVLNITPSAVQNFHMDLSWIGFSARFRGISREVLVPVGAVMAIYAKENGKGMAFDTVIEPKMPPPDPPSPTTPKKKSGRPTLKVVK